MSEFPCNLQNFSRVEAKWYLFLLRNNKNKKKIPTIIFEICALFKCSCTVKIIISISLFGEDSDILSLRGREAHFTNWSLGLRKLNNYGVIIRLYSPTYHLLPWGYILSNWTKRWKTWTQPRMIEMIWNSMHCNIIIFEEKVNLYTGGFSINLKILMGS